MSRRMVPRPRMRVVSASSPVGLAHFFRTIGMCRLWPRACLATHRPFYKLPPWRVAMRDRLQLYGTSQLSALCHWTSASCSNKSMLFGLASDFRVVSVVSCCFCVSFVRNENSAGKYNGPHQNEASHSFFAEHGRGWTMSREQSSHRATKGPGSTFLTSRPASCALGGTGVLPNVHSSATTR